MIKLSKLQDIEKVRLCRQYFYIGCMFLPIVWLVNFWWFYEYAYRRPEFPGQKLIKKYIKLSFLGYIAWMVALLAWNVLFHRYRTYFKEYADYLTFVNIFGLFIIAGENLNAFNDERKFMSNTNFIENFVAGGVGGFFSAVAEHPFDTVKVRLQTMPILPDKNGQMYTGALDCAKKTVKNEGFRAFYKGMSTPLFAEIPLYATFFGAVGIGRWLQQPPPPGENFTFIQNLFTGAFAGLFTCVVEVPTDRIKCVLQVQSAGNFTKYDGPLDAFKKLYKEGGIRNLYRGTGATIAREIPFSGLYIAVYEYLKYRFSIDKNQATLSPIASLFAGGFAGVASWSVSIPQDVIKSRLQTSHGSRYPNGMRSVIQEIMKHEGLKGFFRGYAPVLLHAFPANAACFLGIELTLNIFRAFS